MYQGTNKTALCSQRQVADALLRLMEAKNFASISVRELCAEADISRQTFYTLFSSKENVIIFTLQDKYCYSDEADSESDANESETENIEDFCSDYACYIKRNEGFLKMLVDHEIIHLFYDSIYKSFTECCCCSSMLHSSETKYMAHFIAGGITGIVTQFCLEGCVADYETLRSILVDAFSGKIFNNE